MKVRIPIIISAIILIFASSSCSKSSRNDKEIKETINMVDSILLTDTFTYTLPDNKSDDPYQITTQALHFSKSELSTDSNGKIVYTYIYSGSGEKFVNDDVVIANVEETHSGQHHGTPNSNHKHNCDSARTEITRTINIHFIIK